MTDAGTSSERKVRDVMAIGVERAPLSAPVTEAAARMRDADVGSVLVMDEDRLVGIITDRDIAIRVVAEGTDVAAATVEGAYSPASATVTPDDTVAAAAELMRSEAIAPSGSSTTRGGIGTATGWPASSMTRRGHRRGGDRHPHPELGPARARRLTSEVRPAAPPRNRRPARPSTTRPGRRPERDRTPPRSR